MRDAEGRLVGAASIKRDITERRRAEAELRRHQDQLRLAHRAARIGTWHWDVATRQLTWDEGLRQLYGVASGETVTDLAGFLARVFPEDRERVEASFQQALQAPGGLAHEYRIVRPGGEIRWLADLGQVGVDDEGRPLYVTGICLDITERRAAEERLREAHRLQAAGQLAGGIAHEANNQMSVVLGAVHFLLRRKDLPEDAAADVGLIRRAAERTATITQQLLAFSRRQLLRLENVDLNELVLTAEPLLRRSLAENQELVIRTGRLPGLVWADHNQLEQVLLNLVLNARDAMPEGGQVTIETGREEQTAMLMVHDTGVGMDQQTLQRAFEPFFTTKEVGQGTGLGLSVVHGIVSQIGGKIEAASQPGRGSLFTLRLPIVARSHPIAEGKAAAAGAPPRGRHRPGGGGRRGRAPHDGPGAERGGVRHGGGGGRPGRARPGQRGACCARPGGDRPRHAQNGRLRAGPAASSRSPEPAGAADLGARPSRPAHPPRACPGRCSASRFLPKSWSAGWRQMLGSPATP